jgi:hypothetical protein
VHLTVAVVKEKRPEGEAREKGRAPARSSCQRRTSEQRGRTRPCPPPPPPAPTTSPVLR